MQDRDGQPLAAYGAARNKRKALNALMGLLAGLNADRRLVAEEVIFLDTWLREQAALRDDPDVFDILDATSDILTDCEVTADELQDLRELIATVLEYRGGCFLSDADAVNYLLGQMQGITADRRLHDMEIDHLNKWLHQVRDVRSWPLNILRRRMTEILADGVITPEERTDLLALLDSLCGGAMDEYGVASGMAVTLPVDNSVQVCFEGRHVCPTGKFLYGSRSKVEAAIVERGGLLAANPTKKTDFLVVGSMASKDWAMTSYGRKIEYAMELRAQGCPILVVGEEAFMAALTQPPLK